MEKVLKELHGSGEYVNEEIGVFPLSFEGKYAERTPEMNEHNAKVMRFAKAMEVAESLIPAAPQGEEGIGACDKRIEWADWEAADYQPRNLKPAKPKDTEGRG